MRAKSSPPDSCSPISARRRSRCCRKSSSRHRRNISPTTCSPSSWMKRAAALARANQTEPAKAEFAKAAANYEQSLLINPGRATTYLRLAELLIGPLKESERAANILIGSAAALSQCAGVHLLSGHCAQREAKHPQQAVITFEEALQEAAGATTEMLNCALLFRLRRRGGPGGLLRQGGRSFRKSIALDPANAAEAYNYLGFMWAEHNLHLDEAEEMIKPSPPARSEQRRVSRQPGLGPFSQRQLRGSPQ